MAEFKKDEKIPVIAIVGPTASGKTGLGVALAKAIDGEIISADSMQIYKGMPIASAQPNTEEMEEIPHHLINFLSPAEDFNLSRYIGLAKAKISDIHKKGKQAIIVGGTGLYIDTLLYNINLPEISIDEERKKKLEKSLAAGEGEELLAYLASFDQKLAEKLHKNDGKRIIRAILVYEATGKTQSEHQAASRLGESPYRSCFIGLNAIDRSFLYDRINARVDIMQSLGLLEEARAAYANKSFNTSLAAIGHKEFFPFFEGEIPMEEAVAEVKKASRRYAKRQLTWFRKNKDINWIYIDEENSAEKIVARAKEILKSKGF